MSLMVTSCVYFSHVSWAKTSLALYMLRSKLMVAIAYGFLPSVGV